MNAHRWILQGVAAALVVGAVHGQLSATATPPGRAGLVQIAETAAPVDDLPVLQVHRYKMAGRIRPLLFWIGRNIFDLALTGVESIPPSAATPALNAWPVRASFEIRSRRTGARYTFELEYGTEGALAGVPTLIQYQPRWWLQAKLTLTDGATQAPGGVTDAMPARAATTPLR